MKNLCYLFLCILSFSPIYAQTKNADNVPLINKLSGKWLCVSKHYCNTDGVVVQGIQYDELFREIDEKGAFSDYYMYSSKVYVTKGKLTVETDSSMTITCSESIGIQAYPKEAKYTYILSKNRSTLIIRMKLPEGRSSIGAAYYEEIWTRVIVKPEKPQKDEGKGGRRLG